MLAASCLYECLMLMHTNYPQKHSKILSREQFWIFPFENTMIHAHTVLGTLPTVAIRRLCLFCFHNYYTISQEVVSTIKQLLQRLDSLAGYSLTCPAVVQHDLVSVPMSVGLLKASVCLTINIQDCDTVFIILVSVVHNVLYPFPLFS